MSYKTTLAGSSGISFGDNATHNTTVTGGVGGDYVSGDKHVHEAPSPTVSALHQLPSPPRDFTGREAEIAELLDGSIGEELERWQAMALGIHIERMMLLYPFHSARRGSTFSPTSVETPMPFPLRSQGFNFAQVRAFQG